MKTLKMLAFGFAVLCLVNVVRADKDTDAAKMLVGKWEATKVDEGTLPKGAIVEFAKGNKMSVTVNMDGKEQKMEGTYKIDGTKLTVKLKMGDEEKEHTVNIEKISATEFVAKHDDGKSVTFTKKK